MQFMSYLIFPGRKLAVLGWIIGCFLSSYPAQAFWTTAYYPGYRQQGGMAASAIDFTAVTHIIHFSLTPNANGTTDNGSANEITPSGSANLISLAHAAGVKVLI